MLTEEEKTRLEELRTKSGLTDEEWEELRELDKKEESAAKEPGEASEEGEDGGSEGKGQVE